MLFLNLCLFQLIEHECTDRKVARRFHQCCIRRHMNRFFVPYVFQYNIYCNYHIHILSILLKIFDFDRLGKLYNHSRPPNFSNDHSLKVIHRKEKSFPVWKPITSGQSSLPVGLDLKSRIS